MAYAPKKRRVRKVRKVARRKRGGMKKRSLVKLIRKEIYAGRENKMRQSGGSLFILPTSHSSYQTNCIIPLTPFYEAGLSAAQNLDIAQGTNVASRIGNRIQTKSGYFRAVIFPLGYSATTNPTPSPLNITMWIFKLKSGYTDSTGNVLSVLQNSFFKYNSTAVGFVNGLADSVGTVNTDVVNLLYRRTYKIGYAVAGGTGTQANLQSLANNDYKYNAHIRMNTTRFLRKNIHYVDNNLMPSTSTTYACFTVQYASGAQMTSAIQPAQIEFEYDYRYEDA